nr:hypothetical protein [uncultured Celeribacter sp.]
MLASDLLFSRCILTAICLFHLALCNASHALSPWRPGSLLRRLQRIVPGAWGTVALALWLAPALAAPTGSAVSPHVTPYVVRDDFGGSVKKRMRQIRELNAANRPIEIRGNVCMSSCTMFLGARQVCVDPKTTFVFHGPFRYFSRLSPREFEFWSVTIASYYPKPIHDWYLREGRHKVLRVFEMTGKEVMRHGIPACAP